MIDPTALRSTEFRGGEFARLADLVHVTALPDMLAKLEAQGRLEEFKFAARGQATPPRSDGPWDDSDVHKWMEAVSVALVLRPDEHLQAALDRVIDLVLAAVDETGYIDAFGVVDGHPRWGEPSRGNHVLYNQGHLIEAAIAHRVLDPDSRLFPAAVRLADTIDAAYTAGEMPLAAHQEIELALCRLTQATGEDRYLKLAERMLDDRGHPEGRIDYGPWSQDHEPIVDQREMVGHTVRAMYQNIAADAVARRLGRRDLGSSLQFQWDDLLSTKILISGGSGRVMQGPSGIEGFRAAFDLDSHEVDVDTCTAIGLALWAAQRAEADDDATAADVAEHEIFNRVLAGVSVNMTSYFYGMPLAAQTPEGFDGWGNAVPFGRASSYRQPWYAVPCCPPNIARFLLQLPVIAARTKGDVVTVDQFISHRRTFDDGTVLEISTDYPRDGRVTIGLCGPTPKRLRIRVPGWLSGAVMDGQLYRADEPGGDPVVRIGGADMSVRPGGYLEIEHNWSTRAQLEIVLPMKPRLVRADARATSLRGQTALAIGPLIYCREGGAGIQDEPPIDVEGALLRPHAGLPVSEAVLTDGRTLIPLAALDNRARQAFWVWR